MKKIILLLFTVILLASCEARMNPDGTIVVDKDRGERVPTGNPYIEVYDSCEYIIDVNRMAHKGNCRFCKERQEEALNKLVDELRNGKRINIYEDEQRRSIW